MPSGSFAAPFFVRWAARVVCWWMGRHKENIAWQMWGKKNWDILNGEAADVEVHTSQIMQVVLRECGHEICEATVITQGFHASHEKLFRGKDRVRKAQAWLAAKYRQYENGRAILSSSAKSCPTCGRLL